MDLHLEFVDVFFNDTATTEIYTLSLHDALPILALLMFIGALALFLVPKLNLLYHYDFTKLTTDAWDHYRAIISDRKSTRLNSSHANISYAVFCLKINNTSSTSNIVNHDTDTNSL